MLCTCMQITAIQTAFNWPPCNYLSMPLLYRVSLTIMASCFAHCRRFTAPHRAVNAHPQFYCRLKSLRPDITTAVLNGSHCLTFQTDHNTLTRSALPLYRHFYFVCRKFTGQIFVQTLTVLHLLVVLLSPSSKMLGQYLNLTTTNLQVPSDLLLSSNHLKLYYEQHHQTNYK